MRRSTRHVHLLMALYLLKNYSRSRASAGAFGVHTDTWKYYTDRFVQAISALSPTLVRKITLIVVSTLKDHSRVSQSSTCIYIYLRFAGWIGS